VPEAEFGNFGLRLSFVIGKWVCCWEQFSGVFASFIFPRTIEIEGCVTLAEEIAPTNGWTQQISAASDINRVSRETINQLADPVRVTVGNLLVALWILSDLSFKGCRS
jgi:hypothetical protein